jgi:hypothetical protein
MEATIDVGKLCNKWSWIFAQGMKKNLVSYPKKDLQLVLGKRHTCWEKLVLTQVHKAVAI